MKKNKMLWGYIMVVLSAVIFGLMPLMTKVIRADGVNSFSIVLLRNLIAVPVLAVLALVKNKSLKVPIKAVPSMGLAGLLGSCVTPLLLYTSYTYLTQNDSVATVFHFIYPAVVVFGGWLFFKQKLNVGTAISLGLCIVGICLFYDLARPLNWTGAALALLSGVTFAGYVLILSMFQFKQINGFLFSFYLALINSIVLLLICLVSGTLTLPHSIGGWTMCIFFSLFVTVGAVVLFQKGTFLVGGQKSSMLSTMEPITSIAVNAFSGIFPGVQAAIGALLVIAASVMIPIFDYKDK